MLLLCKFLTLVIGFLRIYITYGGIIEARCKINCITQVLITNQTITSCENNLNCSSCLIPCTSEYKSHSACEAKCKLASNIDLCLESCSYLKLIANQNFGSCPHQEDIVKFDKACLAECSDDSACNLSKKRQKCCYNGCGYTCQQAVVIKQDYPPVPVGKHIFVEENDDASSVRIGWLPKKPPDPGEVVLYIVQGRNHSGKNFRWGPLGPWHTVHVTSELEANIPLEVGRFYQFHVAAANINGSRGYSKFTPAIKLSRDPMQPNPPKNIRKGRSVLTGDGKVNVVISWDPPDPRDLEIIRYRIFWSKRVTRVTTELTSLEEHRETVSAADSSFELLGLEQNTKYLVQVQSIARWGTSRKLSERAAEEIKVEDFNGNRHNDAILGDWDHEGPGPVGDIHFSETYWDGTGLTNNISWQKPIGYENTVNLFLISWRPMQCYNLVNGSSMEATVPKLTSFRIYDLVFDCMYWVWVVPVADKDSQLGQAALISFTTPPCSEVTIAGLPNPVCPTTVPDLPGAPQNVSHMFIIGTEIAVNISWQAPDHYVPPLTGYRIVLTEYHPHPTNFFRDNFPVLQSRYARTVEADHRYIVLQELDAGMRYLVTVSATNSIGGGDLAVLDIKTPIVSMPINPTPPTIDVVDTPADSTPVSLSVTTTTSAATSCQSVRVALLSLILWCVLHWRWR